MLQEESHNFIRKVQLELHQEIGIGLPRQTPHITIKCPFDTEEVDSYLSYFQELARNIQPFELVFKNFGYFGEQVIFLEVVATEALIQLHRQIVNDLEETFGLQPDPYDWPNVKFHASIAGFQSPKRFKAAKAYLSQYTPNFNLRITKIGVFYYLGPGQSWIVLQQYALGG